MECFPEETWTSNRWVLIFITLFAAQITWLTLFVCYTVSLMQILCTRTWRSRIISSSQHIKWSPCSEENKCSGSILVGLFIISVHSVCTCKRIICSLKVFHFQYSSQLVFWNNHGVTSSIYSYLSFLCFRLYRVTSAKWERHKSIRSEGNMQWRHKAQGQVTRSQCHKSTREQSMDTRPNREVSYWQIALREMPLYNRMRFVREKPNWAFPSPHLQWGITGFQSENKRHVWIELNWIWNCLLQTNSLWVKHFYWHFFLFL
jgi:hypothetical protein